MGLSCWFCPVFPQVGAGEGAFPPTHLSWPVKFTWASSLDTLNRGPGLLSLLLCVLRGTSELLTKAKPLGEERAERNLV